MDHMSYEGKDIFDLILERVKEVKKKKGFNEPQAFIFWFIKMYFISPLDIFISDGSKDGKVDAFFKTEDGRSVKHYVVNSKYTEDYCKTAPVKFYEEIAYFYDTFENKPAREIYLSRSVKPELRPYYKNLYEYYDDGSVELFFITNHKKNDSHSIQIENTQVKVFHLDDLIQYVIDDIDGAMPRTLPLELSGINQVLSPDPTETEVATSIVFARLVDFINYMKNDPHDLLFARNIRLNLGNTGPNKSIKDTFSKCPKEFAYSNNGITILCERHIHVQGTRILQIINPRVVNGSQTLHSIRDVPSPSSLARVMVRIIEIPPVTNEDASLLIRKKKEIINRIAIRSNQQNPIKTINLIANDDYQMMLYRHFRHHGIYYERREKEWYSRSRYLKSVGIERGPYLSWLLQLISSYHFDNKLLGPVIAKTPNELCEGIRYDAIRKTDPEVVYQLYLVSVIAWSCNQKLKSIRFVGKYKNYAFLVVFALLIKALQTRKINFGSPEFTKIIEYHFNRANYDSWELTIKTIYKTIDEIFRKTSSKHHKATGEILVPNNYFRNQSYVDFIFSRSSFSLILKIAKRISFNKED